MALVLIKAAISIDGGIRGGQLHRILPKGGNGGSGGGSGGGDGGGGGCSDGGMDCRKDSNCCSGICEGSGKSKTCGSSSPTTTTTTVATTTTTSCLPEGSGSCDLRFIGIDNKCFNAHALVCGEDCDFGACCPDGHGGYVNPIYCFIGQASCPCPENV